MKLSEKLYNSVEQIWNSYYTHPFVKGIGTGELEVDKFRFYMIQDYLYLLEYAKVFALGVVKSGNEETMRIFSEMVYSILNGETRIHKKYMERLHISKEEIENAKASFVNIAYTNYMLWVGSNGGLLEVAVSILACSWSYKNIGERISKIKGACEHEFFGEWIRGYSSEEYKKSNEEILNLVNCFGLEEDCTEKRVNNLKEIFLNCSRYEYLFWDMAYNKTM